MIHGEHYDADISPEIARAALHMGPWRRNIATTVINYQAKNIDTAHTITESVKSFLLENNLSIFDILHVLENGKVVKEPQPTSRSKFFKYSVLGKTLDNFNLDLVVIVVPYFQHGANAIVRAYLVNSNA